MWEQIKVYSERLLSGVIFTGGAANMRNLEVAFERYHHFDKVKTRLMPPTIDYVTNLKLDPQTNTLATLMAMLRRGEDECTDEKPVEPDLFEGKQKEDPTFVGNTPSGGDGTVRTPHTGDAENAENADSIDSEEPKTPKKPSAWGRFWRSVKDAAEGLVDDK